MACFPASCKRRPVVSIVTRSRSPRPGVGPTVLGLPCLVWESVGVIRWRPAPTSSCAGFAGAPLSWGSFGEVGKGGRSPGRSPWRSPPLSYLGGPPPPPTLVLAMAPAAVDVARRGLGSPRGLVASSSGRRQTPDCQRTVSGPSLRETRAKAQQASSDGDDPKPAGTRCRTALGTSKTRVRPVDRRRRSRRRL